MPRLRAAFLDREEDEELGNNKNSKEQVYDADTESGGTKLAGGARSGQAQQVYVQTNTWLPKSIQERQKKPGFVFSLTVDYVDAIGRRTSPPIGERPAYPPTAPRVRDS
jgi:hypothetical protein